MTDTNDAPPSQEKLTELTNAANVSYGLKNYSEAAELYSRATEMQGELLGDEMAPENAELLYLYGRCLYKVAVSKSDVLGGQVAGEKKKQQQAKKASEVAAPSPGQKQAEEVLEAVVEEKEGKKDAKAANQPFFQLVDADWSDEEDEEDAEAEAQEAIEEEDDFATAFEILDVARVLLERQVKTLEEAEHSEGKGKGKAEATAMSAQMRHVKERLSDTHDLQAEISLENEKFAEAIGDFEAAAALKDELYPKSSSIVAEAHYKLSLALEFDSMSAVREAQAKEGEPAATRAGEQPQVDEELRERARKETEVAVESIKLRIVDEESKLASSQDKSKQKEIAEVKEILKEMEDRLKELHAPAITINGPAGAGQDDAMAGILAQVLGESTTEQKARIEEATKNANDLSGLVKKKKPKAAPANGASASADGTSSATNGKRKLDDSVAEGDIKRAKTEELADAK